MATRGYKFYLRVLTSERYFQHEKIKFVSPSGHVMFYLLYRSTSLDIYQGAKNALGTSSFITLTHFAVGFFRLHSSIVLFIVLIYTFLSLLALSVFL